MALDRQTIEKKDFPVATPGYAPEAVDAHLSALADEIAQFKRAGSGTLASSASEQVRVIVQAAETTAAEIQRVAEQEAGKIRAEANDVAHAVRERAAGEVRDQLAKVSASAVSMLQRLDAMKSELVSLIDALPEHAEGAPLSPGNASGGHPAPGNASGAPAAADEAEDAPAAVHDAAGARLIALNMALNGTPRAETDKYLSENFELSDRAGLLDEVYASVGA